MKTFLACIGSMILFATIAGCTFLRDNQTGLKMSAQYVTLKILENSSDGMRATRAANIVNVSTALQSVATGEAVTIPDLKLYAFKELGKLHLSPADQFLANTLIDAVSAELLKRIGDGIVKPDDKVFVKEVLQWIIDAAKTAVPPVEV